MPAKVFISCGQSSPEEVNFAVKLGEWFKNEGFDSFVARDTQSIDDVNNKIIWNLRTADYYLFIDFKREELIPFSGSDVMYRGSLFTHQELALSYLLNFPEAIFLQHKDLHLEGLLKYMLGNAKYFTSLDEAFNIIVEQVNNVRKWKPDFTRSFSVELTPLTEKFNYKDSSTKDSTGKQIGRDSYIQKIRVDNKRVDLPALNTVARLESFVHTNGKLHSPDNSSLKWAGEQLYSKPIYETESAEFDAFAISDNNKLEIYLHSASDIFPRQPIINQKGKHILLYSVSAVGFPKCGIKIEINITGSISSTKIDSIEFGHFDIISKGIAVSSTSSSLSGMAPRSGSI